MTSYEPEVLYQDNHLLIVNKPAGMATQGSSKGEGEEGLEELCRRWLARQQGKERAFLHVVHRLDTPVSGIVIMAASSKALTRLKGEGLLHRKQYLAVVEGKLPHKEGTLKNSLQHDEKKRQAIVLERDAPGGQAAALDYLVIKKEKGFSLVSVRLLTGRYHQIRAQLSAAGAPIVGDAKYGSREIFFRGVIALHHHKVIMKHPTTKETLKIEAPIPPLWHSLLASKLIGSWK